MKYYQAKVRSFCASQYDGTESSLPKGYPIVKESTLPLEKGDWVVCLPDGGFAIYCDKQFNETYEAMS